ncbi:MAG TPA: septum formation initiator family protein [Dehalococcoidia bacterium]|nr:septum formation initiator family protein [Dehalococcoidia bacterium]
MLIRLPQLTPTKIILMGAVIALAYFLATGAVSAIRSHRLSEQEASLRSEVRSLQERYNKLQALIEYFNSDEYIESVAREQLGLVREGESGIIAYTEEPASNETSTNNLDLWWESIRR